MKRYLGFKSVRSISVTATMVTIGLLLLSYISPGAAYGVNWKDNFNNNELSRHWEIYKLGSGSLVSETLQRLEVVLEKDGAGNPFIGGIRTKNSRYVKHSSEFIADVDYSLLKWPMPSNGARVGLVSEFMNAKGKVVKRLTVMRVNDSKLCSPDSDCHAIEVSDGVHPPVIKSVSAESKSGNLRITRWKQTNGLKIVLLAVEKGSGSGYHQLYYETATDADMGSVRFTLQAWAHGGQFTGPAKVAFDNFNVQSHFGFGTNCIAGEWEDNYYYKWKLTEDGTTIKGTVVDTTYGCGTWTVRGKSEKIYDITLNAKNPTNTKCGSFTYTGYLQDCDNISGQWTDSLVEKGPLV